MLRPTPGDHWGGGGVGGRRVEQHHWNTGAKENQQLNTGVPNNRQKKKTVRNALKSMGGCHLRTVLWPRTRTET